MRPYHFLLTSHLEIRNLVECDAKLGIQQKIRNIASFGAKFFELRTKRLPSKFIFSKSSRPLLLKMVNLKFNNSSVLGGLLKKCQNYNFEEIGKHVLFSFSKFLNFFPFLHFSYTYVYHIIR